MARVKGIPAKRGLGCDRLSWTTTSTAELCPGGAARELGVEIRVDGVSDVVRDERLQGPQAAERADSVRSTEKGDSFPSDKTGYGWVWAAPRATSQTGDADAPQARRWASLCPPPEPPGAPL